MEDYMSAIDNTPTNRNFLSPLNFRFFIKKAPHVNFFAQKVNIPSVSLINPQPNNPFVKTPIPGEHLTYGDLSVTFKVDEELKNYLEIHNWIKALGKPQNFDQFKEISAQPTYTGDGIYSDLTVVVLSSTKTPNYEINFADAFPFSLSDLSFNTVDEDVNYIEATANFKYTYYDIKNI